MIRLVIKIRCLPDESPDAYVRRSSRAVLYVQSMIGPWGLRWVESVISWAAHMLRNTNHACWSATLLDVASSHELSARRSQNHNRPGTRATNAWVSRRWTDGLRVALEYFSSHAFKLPPVYSGADLMCTDLRQRKMFLVDLFDFVKEHIDQF